MGRWVSFALRSAEKRMLGHEVTAGGADQNLEMALGRGAPALPF
jgi:hypothetical protein